MIDSHTDGVTIDIYAQPRASKTALVGEHDGMLKVRLAAPPVDGAANAEIVAFFSKQLGVPKRSVSLVSGETGRRKRLLVRDITLAEVKRLLKI